MATQNVASESSFVGPPMARANPGRLSMLKTNIECKSADQMLSLLGPKNRFLLFIWVAMAMLWGVLALPLMGSAFLMDDFCPQAKDNSNGSSSSNCTPRPGTVSEEFHLDTSQSLLSDLSTSAYVAGMAMGSILVPIFADWRGRRPAVVFSLLLSGIAGCASAFSPNIFVFIFLRFIQGHSYSGIALINWVLAYECIPLRLRSHTALVFGMLWALGYCLVAPVAFFTANWRQLIAAASAPALFFAILCQFTVPESFHFLVAKKELAKVRQWIGQANKFAHRAGTRRIAQNELGRFLQHLEKEHKNSQNDEANGDDVNGNQKRTLLNRIWTNRTLLLYLIVFIYIWTCDTFIYYGLSLFSTQLAGNRYLNFTLVALVEIPCYVFTPTLLDRMGRRLFTAFMHILAAVAFLAAFISSQPTFFLCLWLLSKFAISSSFTGLFVYTSEVFPTVHRNVCMGICGFISQAASIFAPTVRIMARLSPIAPMIFFGICSLLAGILSLLLPETRGKELPEKSIISSTESA